jgi:HK97 gp10 family phage protein
MEVDSRPIRKEVLAALTQVKEVKAQMREVAMAIRKDARALAPKRTGTLRRGIRVQQVYDRRTRTVSYIVGWDKSAWYGRLVEFGTEHSQPRPHLIPAAIKNGGVAGNGSDAAATEQGPAE